jgi:hypothetical protein
MKRTLPILLAVLALSLPSGAHARPLAQEATPSTVLTTTQALSETAVLSTTQAVSQTAATPAEAPQVAANAVEQSAPQVEAIPSAPGVQFKLAREGNRYVVYMRPTVTPEQPGLTMTAQVTIRVPHGVDADRFRVADLQSAAPGAVWGQTSRIDAPAEAPDADFISFEFDFESSNLAAYTWQAGQALAAFSFANSGSYQGPLNLMSNCDAFLYNQIGVNAGNQIAILGLNNDNAYLGAYENAIDAPCTAYNSFLPVVVR